MNDVSHLDAADMPFTATLNDFREQVNKALDHWLPDPALAPQQLPHNTSG